MTDNGVKLVAKFEGLPKKDPLAAYWDSYGKVWTIGYGATYYPDGSKVKQGDRLTSIDEALSILKTMLVKYEESVKKCVGDNVYNSLNSNQKDALTSFTYNVGAGNLKCSTLLKLVKQNPNNPKIRDAFMMWNKSGGKELAGLTKRRSEEAAYYFGKSPAEVSNESSHSMVVQQTYQGDGNMFCEVLNKNAWEVKVIKDVDPQANTRRLRAKSRAADTAPDMVSENNGWKVTKFKTVPRKSNNWKSMRVGSALPVVGDLLFAYHDGDPTGKHDHVAIFMGIHEGSIYVVEGYSVEGEMVNEKDKKVQLCKIEDSRLGLDTDIITHFAHHISPEIVQKANRTGTSDNIDDDNAGGEIIDADYKGKWFTIKDVQNGYKYGTDGMSNEEIEDNIKQLIGNTLDPLADLYNEFVKSNGKNKVHISSGYRDSKYNKKVGGARDSQHLAGQAADIYIAGNNKENLRLVKFILEKNIPYDQLIVEGVKYKGIEIHEPPQSEKKVEIVVSEDERDFIPRWIHVSFVAPGKKSPSGRVGNRYHNSGNKTMYVSNVYKYNEKTREYDKLGVTTAKPITPRELQRLCNQILNT